MQKYSLTSRALHWSIAGFLLIQIPLGWYMVDLPLGADKLSNYALHKSLGMVLFSFAVIRLVWAIVSKRPALPATTPLYAKILSRVVQGFLYFLVIVMPLTGWVMSSAANVPVTVFGLIRLPQLVAADKGLMEAMESAHEMQSVALLTLVTVHVLAGLKHFFVDRDNVLYSMLPWAGKR